MDDMILFSVDQLVQTYVTTMLRVLSPVPLIWWLHVETESRGLGSYMSSEEAGQSRSCNAWAL